MLLTLTAMATEVRRSTLPENDVGYSFEMPTMYTESFINFVLQEYNWLEGANIAAEDCTMPEQVSIAAVHTAETYIEMRLVSYRWPNIKCAVNDKNKSRIKFLARSSLTHYSAISSKYNSFQLSPAAT